MSLYCLAGEGTTPVLCSTANKEVSFLLEFSIRIQPFGRMQPVLGYFVVAVELSKGSDLFIFSFVGVIKNAELRILVAGGRRSRVFGRFGFGCNLYLFTGDRSSPSKPHTQKRKKSRKRSRSPPKTTSHGLKRRSLIAFNWCQECRLKISITDTHDLCLACLGRGHPMLKHPM